MRACLEYSLPCILSCVAAVSETVGDQFALPAFLTHFHNVVSCPFGATCNSYPAYVLLCRPLLACGVASVTLSINVIVQFS